MPGLRFARDIRDPDPLLRLAARGVGGFCVFGGDERLPALLRRLSAAAPHPLIFASDVEDGAGQQFSGLTRHPPAAALTPEAAELAGARTAVEARRMGITMAFAPVCDVVSEPRNPILQARAFADPAASAPRFVRGARAMGLRTCAKHFPGHGATTLDSHDALPVVDAPETTWRERDLPPFSACIAEGVDAIMTAHLACPALTGSWTLPATLSRRVMTDLLRGEMGFSGLLVSDALLMDGVLRGRSEAEAAVEALSAACDVVLCPEDVEGVLGAIEGVEAGAALERIAVAAEPLKDPLAAAATASVRTRGRLPAGPGPHPIRIFDLGGAEPPAALRLNLSVPAVAILRRDRAWGGPLVLPEVVRAAAQEAALVILLGPPVLLEGLKPDSLVQAPGEDPLTVEAVATLVLGADRGPPAAPRRL